MIINLIISSGFGFFCGFLFCKSLHKSSKVVSLLPAETLETSTKDMLKKHPSIW